MLWKWRMGYQRFLSVFAGLLIIALVLTVAPVSGAPSFTDPAALDTEYHNSTDPINASVLTWKPAGRHTFAPAAPLPAPDHAAGPAGALIMAPGFSVMDSIGPGDSLQDAIDAAPDGGTVWLDPGTYHEHDIVIAKNIVIRSNASAGGNRGNTVIDAFREGRIFSVTGAYSLDLRDLTLQNGTDPDFGGAILAPYGGGLSVSNTAFNNFSVTGIIFPAGGAIYADLGTVTITGSSFYNCSAGTFGEGGAIVSGSSMTIISTSFVNCSADDSGAILLIAGGSLDLSSSTFRNCRARAAGAIGQDLSTVMTITSSTFVDCSATGSVGDQFGGAIATSGDLTVTGSAFRNCTASGSGVGMGGAIYAFLSGSITITSSEFTGCSSSESGGAIGAFFTGTVTITGSSFTDCSADFWGGAIEAYSYFTVTNSTFTRCSAIDGGALDFYREGAAVFNSTFTDCTATRYGGAILYLDGGSLELVSSTFTRCSAAENGGAIGADGDLSLEAVTFTGCTATVYGGAIFITGGGTADITSSSFTGCSGASGGGAIATLPAALTITSSSFERCSAGSDGGGAILSFATTDVHFSRFYQNTATGSGTAIRFVSGTIDANDNWWGTNSGPGASFFGPTAAVTSWLVLGITADPSSITLPQTSFIRTNLTYNSDGTNTAGGGVFVPNAIPNAYAVVTGPGIVAPVTYGTANGGAQTTYITLQSGTTTIAGTVDGQTVYIILPVAQGTWTPAPTEVPFDDDWPQVSTGASGGGGSAATTGSSAFPLMTVTVNIGGDSKAWQAIVTGTKLSELIVTGTVQSGSGSNATAPPGIVYQYINLVPVRYDTIKKAVINFTVPQAWLDENHIAPGSVVLYPQTANGWEALPTTVLYTKDGTVYFSAQSNGFSLFAIAGTPTVATPPVAAPAPEIVSTPVQEQTPAPAASVKALVTTQTTAPPATAAQPAAPSPVLNIVLVITAIGVLAGGGFMVRRW
jgi:hypothetical protein